jgi:dTDP-4-amino-4,6-dideoxygalactose transaminase
MKFIPSLIPRFNKDYDLGDFVYSIKSTFGGNDVELAPLYRIFGDKNFFFTNTGRTSLYVILKALNFPRKSKIGVPLYSCTVVFDAIIKAGGIPYFIDIDLDNYTLDPADLAEKINDLSALVVIHTFGRPADMDKIKEIAGDVPVIEDCAHSLLSKYKEEQTGTLSFASFFSFKKYLSMGEGGMIILNNNELMREFQRKIDLLDSFTTINEIKDAFVTYGYSFLYHKPWFGLFSYPIGLYLRSIVEQNDDVEDFKVNKIRKIHLNLLFKKLNGFEARIELQRENSFFLLDKLRDTSLILPYEKKNAYCNYYLFPIRFNNKKKRNKAHELLKNMGIDTAKLYGETPIKSKKFYEYGGDCTNSEIIADTILIIPNYYTLSEKDLIKVADSIKKVEGLL